jgi:hypothetical protein
LVDPTPTRRKKVFDAFLLGPSPAADCANLTEQSADAKRKNPGLVSPGALQDCLVNDQARGRVRIMNVS